ncbi:glycosyl hydrolase [Cohnella sp. GCM10012308]|uniref:glycosyl hydrolase n=1 Tax=Cohnella sp. GCM10012308 TaxID=3317329 RepID=UPI00360F5D91
MNKRIRNAAAATLIGAAALGCFLFFTEQEKGSDTRVETVQGKEQAQGRDQKEEASASPAATGGEETASEGSGGIEEGADTGAAFGGGPKPAAFDEAQFADPDVRYRPLLMIHDHLHTGIIKKLSDLGYGGMVTNVDYSGYLKNEEFWEILKQNVAYAIDKLGLRVWIYDEKGYPSGTAGGQVLSEHPELEAQGLAVVVKEAAAGEKVVIEHPYGHGEVRYAAAYRGTELSFDAASAVDLHSAVDGQGNLNWQAPASDRWVVFYFVQKPFYEGTHAVNNWFEQRRYINLLEKDATEAFIDVTHKQYYERLGAYFGKGIEAFFTDEPALTGTYIGTPPRQPSVLDAPDPAVPLLKTLNWGNKLADEFQKRRGYELLPVLPYLIAGEGKEAKRVRGEYYRTLSELVLESYFEPLEAYCGNTGVACSGHLLLEEEMYHQAIYEGNLMNIYRHMQLPGIDLLTAHPKLAKEWAATTAKLASSAAQEDGKPHVMSEISDAFDGDKADFKGRLAAVAVQFAFGVDRFNSYYEYDRMSEEENKRFADYIGRIGYMMDAGKTAPQVAVYYPIESVWAETLPPMSLNPADYAARAVKVSDSFKQTALRLTEHQLDYNYIDADGIADSRAEDGALSARGGLSYKALIVPETTVVDEALAAKLTELATAGVKLVLIGAGPEYIRTDSGLKEADGLYERLAKLPGVQRVGSAKELDAKLKTLIAPDLKLERADPDLLSAMRRGEGGMTYLLVNTADEAKTLSVQFRTAGSRARLWDPDGGEVKPLAVSMTSDGYAKAELAIGERQALVVTFENEV